MKRKNSRLSESEWEYVEWKGEKIYLSGLIDIAKAKNGK